MSGGFQARLLAMSTFFVRDAAWSAGTLCSFSTGFLCGASSPAVVWHESHVRSTFHKFPLPLRHMASFRTRACNRRTSRSYTLFPFSPKPILGLAARHPLACASRGSSAGVTALSCSPFSAWDSRRALFFWGAGIFLSGTGLVHRVFSRWVFGGSFLMEEPVSGSRLYSAFLAYWSVVQGHPNDFHCLQLEQHKRVSSQAPS